MHCNLKILFAEDDIFNRMFTLDFLKAYEYDVITVSNGEDAVDACKNQHFDVIIMDISMPKMTGVQASHMIRNDKSLNNNSETPIIALTSLDSESDIITFFEVGMNYYLRKPPDFFKLNKILSQIYENLLGKGSSL